MRIATLAMMALPLVLAHTSPMDRKSHERHSEMERRQLFGPAEEDEPASSSALNTIAAPGNTRLSTTSAPAPTSAVTTTARSISTTTTGGGGVLPTSLLGGIVGGSSASSTGLPSGSGSVSGSSSRSSSGVSASGTNSTSSAPASSSSSAAASSSGSASASIMSSMDDTGRIVIVTQYYNAPASASSAAAAAASSAPPSNEGPSLPVGAIIGISVAVGVVILGLIGCAVWRMKRRTGDEDEAIRWPELNRHGDSDAHHALPARATGKHGIETDALERTLSNSSEVYMTQTHGGRPPSMPMALNGSNFGAASALDYNYTEKDIESPHAAGGPGGYDYGYPVPYHSSPDDQNIHNQQHPMSDAYDVDDYSNMPPQVIAQPIPGQGAALYESDSDGEHGGKVGTSGLPVYR